MDKYFIEAERCVQNDKLEEAILLYKKSIEECENYESAYGLGTLYLDCYPDLGMSEFKAIEEASQMFLLGAYNKHQECLEMILEEKENFFASVEQNHADAMSRLAFVEDYCKLLLYECLEKNVRTFIKNKKTKYIEQRLKEWQHEAQTLAEIEELYKGLFKYIVDDEHSNQIREHYLFCKVSLFLREQKSVVESLKMVEEILQDDACNDRTLDLLYRNIARGYWNGEQGVDKDTRLAIEYYSKVNKVDIVQEEAWKIVSFFLDNGEIDNADKCISWSSGILYNKIKNRVDFWKDQQEKKVKPQERLLKKWHEYGFEGFLHTTEIYNFKKIVERGQLIPRKRLNDSGEQFIDKADQSVISITKENIKDCCRFYYYFKTPTNYNAEYNHPVILVFSEKLVYDERALFASGNAAKHDTRITNEPEEAIKKYFINWDAVFERGAHSQSKYFKNEEDKEYLNSIRNTDFLIKGSVPIELIEKVYFKTQEDMFEAEEFCDKSLSRKFELRRDKFYD